jgi:hypothetical protein
MIEKVTKVNNVYGARPLKNGPPAIKAGSLFLMIIKYSTE